MATTDAQILHAHELALLGMDISDARGLPARLYTDPDIYEAEKETIFRRQWMPVFHQSSIPNPGDYRVVQVYGESFLFVRGDDRKLRGFHNICLHRGAKVADGSGTCSRFRCPYHTWTYDLKGNLIGAPEMAHVVREGGALREVSVDTYLGYVFFNDYGNAPPLSEKLAGLSEALAPWASVGDQLVELFEIHFPGEWNWKLAMENGLEGYHVLGSHYESAQHISPGELTYSEITEYSDWTGFNMPFAEGAPRAFGTDGAVPMDDLPEWAERESRFFGIWPSFPFMIAPEFVGAAIIIPGATAGEVDVVWVTAVRPESKDLPGFAEYQAEQIEFAKTIQPEDNYPCETMWENLHSPSFVPGPYAKQEVGTYQFDQWYLDQMAS
jgi:phenylpropionate dioxygenase-like ring-hydroxylating dioxygenase large terminal subunit